MAIHIEKQMKSKLNAALKIIPKNEKAGVVEIKYETQEEQGKDGQKLRGRGVMGALAGAALLGTAAAALGGAMRRPYYGGYGYGYGMRPLVPPPPMIRPPMMGPRMGMMGPRMGMMRRRF